MNKSGPLVLLLGLGTLACPENEPSLATLELLVPGPAEAVAECSSAGVYLFVDDQDRSCPVVTFISEEGQPTTFLVCPESKGLLSDEPYTLEVVYLVDGKRVARAPVRPSPTVLATGHNKLQIALADVDRSVDDNGNGTPDIQDICQ